LIRFRTFRNSDPPLLADVWRSQASHRGLMQPMSSAVLEQLVLGKTIFDRAGLILAHDEHKVLGFVHAGFGPTPDQQRLSTEQGVTSMLMTRPLETDGQLASGLLERSEQYLRERGAKALFAGGPHPLDPFYLGLYGGSELSGILDSDMAVQEIYQSQGYREISRTLVLQRDLARFRPIVDRRQMQIRRRTSLQVITDPLPETWWEACIFGAFDRTRFDLQSRDGGPPCATATFWTMQPLAATWGVHAVGLTQLDVLDPERRQGMATYLLGEAFRHLSGQGVSIVEVQVREQNAAARKLFAKLGFEQVDQAAAYRKD